MDPDRTTPPTQAPFDDAALAAAVREVADDWRMPPQRFDEVTWRDRVGRGRGSAGGGGRRGVVWSRRLFGAAALAVVVTISVSYLAVWLSGPSRDQAATNPSTASSGTPGVPTPGPSATAPAPSGFVAGELPKVALRGVLPIPSAVMVETNGRFVLADLATGDLGGNEMNAYEGPSTVLSRPGGGWVCVCAQWTQLGDGTAQGLRLTLDVVDAAGTSVERRTLTEYSGRYDPNVAKAEQPQLVDAQTTPTSDGRYALISSSARDAADGWVIGVEVLDLSSLEVTSSAHVAVDTRTPDGHVDHPWHAPTTGPRTRPAPSVSISPSGQTLLLGSSWYVEDATDPTPSQGVDRWTAPFAGGRIAGAGAGENAALDPIQPDDAADCGEFGSGLIDDSRFYATCWDAASGNVKVRRLAFSGLLDTTELVPDDHGSRAAFFARTDDALFMWNPFGASVVRFDFDTATVTQAQAPRPTSSVPADVLASIGRGIGRWIAPSAFAKVFLQPGIVASADGTRIYALGIGGSDGGGGSTGVYAFDATSLDVVGTWAPLGDLTSLAVSADGAFVYAAGQGGVSVTGQPTSGIGASMTVYDTTDGSVRLVAGKLGSGGLSLAEPIVH